MRLRDKPNIFLLKFPPTRFSIQEPTSSHETNIKCNAGTKTRRAQLVQLIINLLS
uniref:Uncharacterized protein n=1 Tax=Rhizophora mucronata TaxID=61149 RepID=A0A2P2LZ05_RHIMU